MALRMVGKTMRCAKESFLCRLGLERWTHRVAQSPPFDGIMGPSPVAPSMALPESSRISENSRGLELPSLSFGGSMSLLAAPKRRGTRRTKRIRNAAKALKPIPVIIRCRVCGRLKRPNYYCCRGRMAEGPNDSTHRS